MTTPSIDTEALRAAYRRLGEFESGARGPYSNIASDLRLVLDALKDAVPPRVRCCDGSVISNTCDTCGDRHCRACDPCDDYEDHP